MEFLSLQCSRSLSQESSSGLKDKSNESSYPEQGARAVFCFLSGKAASSYPQSRERSISCFSSKQAGNSYLEQKAEEASSSTWSQVVLLGFSPSQTRSILELCQAGCLDISDISQFANHVENIFKHTCYLYQSSACCSTQGAYMP